MKPLHPMEKQLAETGRAALKAVLSGQRAEQISAVIPNGFHLTENSAQEEKDFYLAHAAHTGNLKLLRYSLRVGANTNSKNIAGFSPLHWAVASPNTAAFNVLVLHGANPHKKSREGVTPLLLAADLAINHNNHEHEASTAKEILRLYRREIDRPIPGSTIDEETGLIIPPPLQELRRQTGIDEAAMAESSYPQHPGARLSRKREFSD